jgi:phage terminase large subunit
MSSFQLTGGGIFSTDSALSFLNSLEIFIPQPARDRLTWRPQKRQATCIDACGLLDAFLNDGQVTEPKARLIGYGGAAGGGKSDNNLGIAAIAAYLFPGCSIGYFRRTFPQLEGAKGAIARSLEMFQGITRYNAQKHTHTFIDTGSTLHFCHCQNEKDVHNYQSQQFDILIFDEGTQFTWYQINYMITRNRATVDGVYAFTLITTNPGGIGHSWFKKMFITPGEPENVYTVKTPEGTLDNTFFIPALLEDNQILMQRDPDYERKLESRGGTIAAMLRRGEWDVFAGSFFPTWMEYSTLSHPGHVIGTREPEEDWYLYGSVDYGFGASKEGEKPFVYHIYAVTPDRHIKLIDEVQGAEWGVSKQIEEIKRLEGRYKQKIRYRCGCPSMFIRKEADKPTIAQQYAMEGVSVKQSVTDHINGWARCREALEISYDGTPWFEVYDRCTHFIEQIGGAILDPRHPEELDPACEDHALEPWRHFLMSRPAFPKEAEEYISPFSAEALLRSKRAELYYEEY